MYIAVLSQDDEENQRTCHVKYLLIRDIFAGSKFTLRGSSTHIKSFKLSQTRFDTIRFILFDIYTHY